jgi:ATP-binding cassette, subfamily B, bacterial PglK
VARPLDNVRHFAVLVGRDRPWRWWLLLGLAVLVSLIEAVGALLVFALLRVIAAPDTGVVLPALGDLAARFPALDRERLGLALAGVVAAFFVLRFVVLVCRAYAQNRLIHNAGALLAGDLLRGYLALPYLYHTTRNSAAMVRNAFDGTQKVVDQALRPVVEVCAEAIVVLGWSCCSSSRRRRPCWR